jgi:hypothetical protein
MPEPITLTVGTIAALAFTKFLESSAGEAAKEFTPMLLGKMDTLRKKIWVKLRGIPEVDTLNMTIENGGKVTDPQIRQLTPHLEDAMRADYNFAQEVRQLASEINQEIDIGEILGKNIQNVYGGSAVQINDPNAPVFTGDISGGTFNFTFNK